METSRMKSQAGAASTCRLNSLLLLLALLAFGLAGCGRGHTAKPDADMARLVVDKRAQTKELAATQSDPVPGDVWKFFDAAGRGDYFGTTNVFERLQKASGRGGAYRPKPTGFWGTVVFWAREVMKGQRTFKPSPALGTALWCPIQETLGVTEAFHDWDGKLLRRFGGDIIDSIPTNSIYFGGNDAGRYVITALSHSHRAGRPFFTLTQNALADGIYLDYLRKMYGSRIYVPTVTDSQNAFSDYMADASQRMQTGKLKPGEDVKVVANRVQLNGHVSMMEINARLARIIFDQNPGHEFYVVESFPLDWMYPHLSPNGLIFKLNREPLAELSEAAVRGDHEYWQAYTGQLIGDWLGDDTSVKAVCDFAERVYLRKDLSTFRGDGAFVRNDAAQKCFSKLRSSIGGMYVWRAAHAQGAEEKGRMEKEADFAFRLAFALRPHSPEAVFRYAQFLLTQNRRPDALLVAETCHRIDPNNPQVAGLAEQLKKMR